MGNLDSPAAYGMIKLFTVKLPFKLISKSNHKGMGRYLPAKYRVFEDSIALLSRAECKAPMIKLGWAVIRPHFKNKLHVDLVNIQKSLLDGLVKGGVFSDDKYIACTVVPAIYGDQDSEVEIWS